MFKIYCTIPTPEIEELGRKVGKSTAEANNLVSVWQSINNKPNVIPTEQQLKELIQNNQKEIEAYRFAVPYYKVGERSPYKVISISENQGEYDISDLMNRVKLENGELTLYPYSKNTNIEELQEVHFTDMEFELINKYAPGEFNLSGISNLGDLHTILLWTAVDLINKFGTTDVNTHDFGESMSNSLQKFKDYKELQAKQQPAQPTNPQIESEQKKQGMLRYQEMQGLKASKGRLAETHRDKKTGDITISIERTITPQEVFDYMEGKDNSVTSQQKKLVLQELEKNGITLEDIKELIKTNEDAKNFIRLHEQSHANSLQTQGISDFDAYDRSNMLSPVNIGIETRATMDAYNQMVADRGTPANFKYRGRNGMDITDESKFDELPEIGIPEAAASQIQVNKESPRAILVRQMNPQEINTRENMIARDFSRVIDEALEDMKDGLRSDIESETDPLNRLRLATQLDELEDPIKGRRAVIKKLGIREIMDRIKEGYQDWVDMDDVDIDADMGEGRASYVKQAYQKVLDNFDILFDEASSMIEQAEHLRIVRGGTVEVQNTEDQDITEDEDLGDDENGNRVNGNEGYTFKIRFVDSHETARAETRKVLSNIKQVDVDGNVTEDDLGNVIYVREDFAHSALLASLNWMADPDDFSVKYADGTYSLPALERAAQAYPWINQVINELQSNPDLISVFYNDFRKEYISYWMQRGNQSFPMNTPVAYDSTLKGIQYNYENGNPQDSDSIFDVNLNISKRNIEKAEKLVGEVQKALTKAYDNEDMAPIAADIERLLKILGFNSSNINIEALKDVANQSMALTILSNINDTLQRSKQLQNGQHYVDTIKEPLQMIAKLIGKVTELDAKTTFRQGKDTYPSYAAPNYIETVFKKLISDNVSKREEFLQKEFGRYKWFRNAKGEWNNEWLNLLANNSNVREMLSIVNMFNIEGVDYSDWTPTLIATGFMNQYFAIAEDPDQVEQYGYYNFPIFSDTQMATFVKFIKYTGDYKSKLIPLYRKLVKQELDRINLVEERAKKGIPPISHFDKRGREFCFIPELNTVTFEYNGQERRLLDIIRDLQSKKDLDSINSYIDQAITSVIDGIADDFIANHSEIFTNDYLDFVKSRTRVKSNEAAMNKVREYVWNQIFASSQMVQIVTTDLAYYKDGVDFQKRFKEVYAAGTKLNTNSKYGRKTERTVYIRDIIVTSPTYIPLRDMFKKAYDEERISKMDYDSILEKFKNVNAVDGQAYRSLSSYRALMDMLGRWTPKMEEAFDRLRHGEWDMSDFNTVWQTIKPFVYGQVETPDGLGDIMKTPHQNKNSEFILLATYQALGTALNSSPQLRGLNKFMEDNDIDVVQFESAVKVGCSGVIDINVSPSKVNEAATKGLIEFNGREYKVPNLRGLDISTAFDRIKKGKPKEKGLDDYLEEGTISQEEYNSIIKDFALTEAEVYNTLTENTKQQVRDTDVMKNGYNMTTVHEISYDDYMIAQPTPEHLFDVESIVGSQFRNLIYANLPDDIELNLGDTTIKGKDKVKQYYFSIMVENLLDSYKDLNEAFSSIEALQKRLLSIVKGNPKYSRDILNALEIVEVDGRKTFNVPFSDRIIATKMEELLTSMFKNSITKQYIKGASCILVSNFGFTDELEVVRRKDGSIEAVECYLPAYSRKFYEPFLSEVTNSQGKVMGYKIDYNKLKEADKSLLDFVGYRIPTEAKYSMLPLRIKGFLPQQNGSAIMLPAEITTLSGSDFDVDKLFMMLPEFKRVQTYDVNRAWGDFYNDPNNSDIVDEINENITKGAEIKDMPEEDFLMLLYDSGHRKYELSETAQERFSDWFEGRKKDYFVKEKFEVVKYDHSKEPKDNSREQRNNEIINIAFQILTNKMVGEESQRPGNFDGLKGVSRTSDIASNPAYIEAYKRMYGLKSNKEMVQHLLNSSLGALNDFIKTVRVERNPLTTDTFIYYHNQNMTGKALVGIYANNTTMQAKFQDKGLMLKDGFEFTVSRKTIKSLSDVYTEENGRRIRISDNCSQFSAASVDNVKDPVLASLMQNSRTANVACFMLRAGMSIPEIGAFFNIPIVRGTIETSGSLQNLNKNIRATEEAIAKELGRKDFRVKPLTEITVEELMENTIEVNTIDINTPKEEAIDAISKQLRLAKLFSIISEYSKALNETVQAYRADSPNGAIGRSVAIAKIQTMNIDRLLMKSRRPDFPLAGIERVIRNNYITPDISIDEMREKLMKSNMPMLQAFYSLGIDFGVKRLAEYFVSAGEFADNVVDTVSINSTRPLKEENLQTIYNAILQFALSGTNLFGSTNNMSLEEKRHYYLSIFPKEFNKVVHDNPDIARIPFIQKLSNTPNGIIMRDSARNSHYLINLLMNSVDSLLYMDNPEAQKLAVNLFNYAYFKEGLGYGPNSFSQYFSTTFKTSFPEYINTLRELYNSIGEDSRWDRFITQLYANNPSMAPVVVVSKDYYSEDLDIISIPSKEVNNPNLVTPTPLSFIGDTMTGNLYKLNEFTANQEIVQYDKISIAPGNLYDMNKDSNDMVEEHNKFQKTVDRMNEKGQMRQNLGVTGNPITGSENPVVNSNTISGSELIAMDDVFLSSIEDQIAAEETSNEYDPIEGFDKEGLKPCGIMED